MKKDLSLQNFLLLQKLKKGDEAALKLIIEYLKPSLLADATYVLSNDDEAEDIVQSIFINLWRLKSMLADDLDLKMYLRRAVEYESRANIKKKNIRHKRQQNLAYLSASATFHHPIESTELGTLILEEINRLSPSCRRSFIAKYLEDQSLKEIAAVQNISIQTVKNNISQALKILREKLKHLLQ